MKYLMIIAMLFSVGCGANKVLVKVKTCQAVDRNVQDVAECEEFNP